MAGPAVFIINRLTLAGGAVSFPASLQALRAFLRLNHSAPQNPLDAVALNAAYKRGPPRKLFRKRQAKAARIGW